jgi:hypothetical protein
MTLEKLKQFRTGVYTILGKAKDALFDLMDAVLVLEFRLKHNKMTQQQ